MSLLSMPATGILIQIPSMINNKNR